MRSFKIAQSVFGNLLDSILKEFHWARAREKPFNIQQRSIQQLKTEDGLYRAIATPDHLLQKPYPVFGTHGFIPCIRKSLPQRSVSTVKNCCVYGATTATMTMKRGYAIHWVIQAELSLDKVPFHYGETFKRSATGWTFTPHPTLQPTIRVDRAVLIGSRFSFNYFHFIVEVLVRLILSEEHCLSRGVPLLVPKLHPNMMELLTEISDGRSIISLGPNDLIQVEQLEIPVASDYSPDDPNDVENAIFDATMLPILRERILKNVYPQGGERIIFIRRKDQYHADGTRRRSLVNQEEVIKYINEIGGIAIEPENLSVNQQKVIFGSAEVVIGIAGAGIANMIFARPGSTFIVLAQNTNAVSPEYFGFMAQELGLRYAIVACEPVPGTNAHPAHLSIRADLRDLTDALAWASQTCAAEA